MNKENIEEKKYFAGLAMSELLRFYLNKKSKYPPEKIANIKKICEESFLIADYMIKEMNKK